MAKVLIKFRDAESWELYDVGDEWYGPPERLNTLVRGGYVQSGLIAHDTEENGSNGSTDAVDAISSYMTVAQLREIAESRGIDVPKRATKAKLMELLGV